MTSRFVLGASALSLGLALMNGACTTAAQDGPAQASDDVTAGQDAGQEAPTGLTLACSSSALPGVTFDVEPSSPGRAEGRLETASWHSFFACQTASGADATSGADAGAADVLATCTERLTSAHPGTYTMVIRSSAAGDAITGELTMDAASPPVPFTCTGPSPDPGDAGPPDPDGGAVTFAHVAPIIKKACHSCHTGMWTTVEKVKRDRPKLVSVISTGRMPRGAPATWRTEGDGAILLEYLRTSPEVQ